MYIISLAVGDSRIRDADIGNNFKYFYLQELGIFADIKARLTLFFYANKDPHLDSSQKSTSHTGTATPFSPICYAIRLPKQNAEIKRHAEVRYCLK